MEKNSPGLDWLNREMYPFKPNYLELASGKMHYVDEGEGEVILFVHGIPTWSFIYREFIKQLSENYRCIAIDHLGFGLSDKPEKFAGTPQSHARNLSDFILNLGLMDITLVVHDFGGPIGFSSALELQGRVRRIVLFNTWLWETRKDARVVHINRLVNSWIGQMLYLQFNISSKVLLKKAFYEKESLTRELHRHYLKTHLDSHSRRFLLVLARSLFGASNWYQQLWSRVSELRSKPMLILWGSKDPFLNEDYLKKWESKFPFCEVAQLECGHFVQEERSDEAISEMSNFLIWSNQAFTSYPSQSSRQT